jgi:hypothetical protein
VIEVRKWATVCVTFIALRTVWADALVFAPAPRPGHVGDPPQVGTLYPFLIKLTVPWGSSETPTMRYQQVCAASLFTKVDPTMIYVTSLTFWPNVPTGYCMDWTVPNMQINLSTTSNHVDGLSQVFQENVGADDTAVFGPAAWRFNGSDRTRIPFDRPFQYDPSKGHLLIDVRVFDGSGQFNAGDATAATWAYNSPTDEVSRVWATNVTALSADGADTVGLHTLIQLSPVPSLSIQMSTLGTPTNYIILKWPTQPTGFDLHRSTRLGSNASWLPVINVLVYSNEAYHTYEFPAPSNQGNGFYRLIQK